MVGPNAPLYTSTQKDASPYSVVQTWDAWTTAGTSPSKLVLGVPFYGYASKPKQDMTYHDSAIAPAHETRPQGDADDELVPALPCRANRHGYTGLWKWRSLRNAGLLLDDKMPGGQWIRNWDAESQTPWLYNPVSHIAINYDDPESLALKAGFARCRQARGIGVWDLAFDYYTAGDGQLLSVIDAYFRNSSSSPDDSCRRLAHPLPVFRMASALSVDHASRAAHSSSSSKICVTMTNAITCIMLLLSTKSYWLELLTTAFFEKSQ